MNAKNLMNGGTLFITYSEKEYLEKRTLIFNSKIQELFMLNIHSIF